MYYNLQLHSYNTRHVFTQLTSKKNNSGTPLPEIHCTNKKCNRKILRGIAYSFLIQTKIQVCKTMSETIAHKVTLFGKFTIFTIILIALNTCKYSTFCLGGDLLLPLFFSVKFDTHPFTQNKNTVDVMTMQPINGHFHAIEKYLISTLLLFKL